MHIPTRKRGGPMTGKYRHNIDSKGRLFVPARLREELGNAFYVTIGLQHSLMVLPEDAWKNIEEKKQAMPLAQAQKLRFFFANAVRCEPDKQGRILLPSELRNYGNLDQEVVMLGFGDKAEIWNASVYDAMEQAFLKEENMDAVFASLEI